MRSHLGWPFLPVAITNTSPMREQGFFVFPWLGNPRSRVGLIMCSIHQFELLPESSRLAAIQGILGDLQPDCLAREGGQVDVVLAQAIGRLVVEFRGEKDLIVDSNGQLPRLALGDSCVNAEFSGTIFRQCD